MGNAIIITETPHEPPNSKCPESSTRGFVPFFDPSVGILEPADFAMYPFGGRIAFGLWGESSATTSTVSSASLSDPLLVLIGLVVAGVAE